MDTNLEDPLLESDMGVDFDHEQDTIIHQDDMTGDESLPMEFEHIEEQPILMDTGSEEIIISDFMGDQFTLQEYQTQEDGSMNVNPKAEPVEIQEHVLTSDGENMIDLQFQQPITVQASGIMSDESLKPQPRIVSIKAAVPAMRSIAPKKQTVVVTKAIAPKQVAIAPKPPKLVTAVKMTQFGKQYTIAPKPAGNVKPMTIVTNKAGQVVKKVSIPTSQDPTTGNAVLTIGKQLVMLPPGGAQKIKLVTSGPNAPSVRLISSDKSQLISTQNLTGQQNPKQMMTKVVVKGSNSSEQPAVLTKLVGAAGAGAQPRYVMHSNTVPISIANAKFANVVIGSPTKSGIRYTQAKKQVVINTPPNKVGGMVTKKIVVSANPAPAAVAAQTGSPTRPMVKVAPKTPVGQKTELHQINVPGKGVQYIRLVTNTTQAWQATNAPNTNTSRMIVTDTKGNRISVENVPSSQPPPLIVTSGAAATEAKQSPKGPKLVKIAPVWTKQAQAAMNRGGQSLLAPLSPATPTEAQPPVSDATEIQEQEVHTSTHLYVHSKGHVEETALEDGDNGESTPEAVDSKSALRQLIADTIGSDGSPQPQSAQYDNQQSQGPDHPLIVIPSYMKQDLSEVYDNSYNNANDDSLQHSPNEEESKYGSQSLVKISVDPFTTFQPTSPSEGSFELNARPRRACNCTKSQCLKLYCDCFANGEFCHRCNCTNCHNSLEHEHLRQKAIKGCLDRNPNAFRPKIGKAKAGEPDRRHNKGCNCKRSGCLKNYCECYEAKIGCTSSCRCVGCRNVEESAGRGRGRGRARGEHLAAPSAHAPHHTAPHHTREPLKQPCSFMTSEVIEAVCQCLIAASVESPNQSDSNVEKDPISDVIDEFARCLQDIISASNQATPLTMFDEAQV